MGVVKRMRDITAATWNESWEHAQDPMKAVESFLVELANRIRQTEALHKQCFAHEASVRNAYLQAESLVDKRERQAMTALKAGEELVARAALAEKMIEEEKRDGYRGLYEQSRLSVMELEQQLAELRRQYQEVYYKRQYIAARVESLRLQQRMNERSRSNGAGTDGWFYRIEERISDMEAETRAAIELRQRTGGMQFTAPAYSSGQRVDEAFEHMKRKLQGGEAGV